MNTTEQYIFEQHMKNVNTKWENFSREIQDLQTPDTFSMLYATDVHYIRNYALYVPAYYKVREMVEFSKYVGVDLLALTGDIVDGNTTIESQRRDLYDIISLVREAKTSSIVISNELLDARPFERFVFQNGKWHKAFIQISAEDDAFLAAEILQAPLANEIAHIEKYFYPASVEGFRLDISFDALHLFEEICKKAKGGILIFADYFRTADEICHLPYGTARTYLKHTDTADFFIDATDCDITHSPCCDPLLDIAKKYFSNATELPQEKFFLSNAENIIREITLDRNPFSARKRELAQLLSPVFMGAAFRILFAF